MTTPETPASVDGGPDLLTELAARLRHRVEECGVEMTCMFDEDGCHGCAACEQDEAALARYDREHARPSTRDAALREEGRVQALAMRALEKIACEHVAFPETNYPGYASMALVAAREALTAIRVLASQPDASQGSAPRTDLEVFEDPVTGEPLFRPAPPAAPQGSPLPGQLPETESYCLAVAEAIRPAGWALAGQTVLAVIQGIKAVSRNPPEGGALEGEMAEALRAVVVGRQCSRLICGGDCRCDVGRAKRLLARYDASKVIPQGERTWQQERADVVAWLRGSGGRIREAVAKGVAELDPLHTEGMAAGCVSAAFAIEAGVHIQPPAPAIPQSGDEKEGT